MWKRLDVVFTLKSPLHIGYLPSKGSVISRTRYYVPGKNFWGAITKGAAENLFDCPDAKNYLEIGEQIKNNFRFMYFYLYNGKTEYTPEFTNRGLKYGTVDVLEFERKFIGSRISTAIDGTKGTAKDESLHEIEFINDKHRDDKGNTRNTELKGVIWVKEDAALPTKDRKKNVELNNQGIFVDGFNLIEKLILGGEQNYGFGLVELKSIRINDSRDTKITMEKGAHIPCHLEYRNNILFQGEIELLGGRGYFDAEDEKKSNYNECPGKILSKTGYYIVPGSSLSDRQELILQWNGIMKVVPK